MYKMTWKSITNREAAVVDLATEVGLATEDVAVRPVEVPLSAVLNADTVKTVVEAAEDPAPTTSSSDKQDQTILSSGLTKLTKM